jgi:cation:H+ antiporter
MLWLQFIACVLIILFAGARTTSYADIIAEKTGLGRLWVGTLILGIVTSMPELVTSVSSVSIIHNSNLGLGTLIGTCIFNLCLVVILDIMNKDKPVLSIASKRHISSLIFGIALALIIVAGIALKKQMMALHLSYISLPSMALLVIYLLSVWRLSKQRRETPPDSSLLRYEHTSGRFIWLKLAATSLTIIGAGIWLSYIGEDISAATGWGTTFVGSLLLAITTSLPELTVAVTSARLGAIDLAIGDILGANILDLTYVFALDVFDGKPLIFTDASSSNLVTLSLFIVMNVVIMIALKFTAQRKLFEFTSWYTPILVGSFILGSYILYIFG